MIGYAKLLHFFDWFSRVLKLSDSILEVSLLSDAILEVPDTSIQQEIAITDTKRRRKEIRGVVTSAGTFSSDYL